MNSDADEAANRFALFINGGFRSTPKLVFKEQSPPDITSCQWYNPKDESRPNISLAPPPEPERPEWRANG